MQLKTALFSEGALWAASCLFSVCLLLFLIVFTWEGRADALRSVEALGTDSGSPLLSSSLKSCLPPVSVSVTQSSSGCTASFSIGVPVCLPRLSALLSLG